MISLYRGAERALIAQTMLDLVLTLYRRGRLSLPRRASLSGEIELLLILAVVLIGHVGRKPRTAAEVGRTLTIPRVTARRKLQELARRGVVERMGKRYVIVDNRDKSQYKHVDAALDIIARSAKNVQNERLSRK